MLWARWCRHRVAFWKIWSWREWGACIICEEQHGQARRNVMFCFCHWDKGSISLTLQSMVCPGHSKTIILWVQAAGKLKLFLSLLKWFFLKSSVNPTSGRKVCDTYISHASGPPSMHRHLECPHTSWVEHLYCWQASHGPPASSEHTVYMRLLRRWCTFFGLWQMTVSTNMLSHGVF